ncbi:MAG: OPT/YSL family transporter, partial [Candidatus Babeliales bacterium]
IVFVIIVSSIFSTLVMSYIAMASGIGPWIETTLVLFSMLFFNIAARFIALPYVESIGLTTSAGGIGGIMATSFAFSLPTLYFIAPEVFNAWMANPLLFFFIFTVFALAAGSFGFLMAEACEEQLLVREKMKFPIGELVYNTIVDKGQINRARELVAGFFGTQFFLQIITRFRLISETIVLNNTHQFSMFIVPTFIIPLTQFPMYIAVGFVTGYVIAMPLLVGFLLKMLCLNPLFYIYTNPHAYFPSPIFSWLTPNSLTESEFSLAFCSGMVVYGAAAGFWMLLPSLKNFVVSLKEKEYSLRMNVREYAQIPWLASVLILLLNSIILWHFEFSLLMQLYLFIFSGICIYQMLIIAGKMGIIPLGRFATFVMIPGMLLFNLNAVQITLIAAFVEIAGGVAGDILFGRRVAQLASIERKKMVWAQWIGFIVSALVIGVIFWVFINNLGLGKAAGLPVIKAYNRALLINFKSFDFYVLVMGIFFGYFVKFTKINPALLLGGILMPPNISLMLIVGGLVSLMVYNKEQYYPLMSGISAGNSVWLLLHALLRA